MKALCRFTTVIEVTDDATEEEMFREFVNEANRTFAATVGAGKGISTVMFEVMDDDSDDFDDESYFMNEELHEADRYEDMYDFSDDKFLDTNTY